MFGTIIRKSIAHRTVVIALTALVAVVGALSYRSLIIDAVPDITNVQVQINTEAAGYSPFEVERRITAPLEIMLAGAANADEVVLFGHAVRETRRGAGGLRRDIAIWG